MERLQRVGRGVCVIKAVDHMAGERAVPSNSDHKNSKQPPLKGAFGNVGFWQDTGIKKQRETAT